MKIKHNQHIIQSPEFASIDNIPINFFGCLKNTVTICEDIVAPIDEKWETIDSL